MERLTNADHKEIGFYSYCGEKNPYTLPLTIGELAGFLEEKYSPREILEEVFARLAAYEDTGIEPEDVSAQFDFLRKYSEAADGIGVKRLRELAQAEKDGRLVVLPCKVGDVIYVIPSSVNYALNLENGLEENNRVYKQTVSEIRFCGDDCLIITCDGICSVVLQFYRENWFLSRTEAEEKLSAFWETHKHLSHRA